MKEQKSYEAPMIQLMSDGGFAINMDKLEERVYTPKELIDIIIEAKEAVEKSLPITKEFIESFGFELDTAEKASLIEAGAVQYIKGRGAYIPEFILTQQGEKYSLYMHAPVDPQPEKRSGAPQSIRFGFTHFFTDYTCTTQSELRFLLTKGRIDCSK